MMVHKRGRVVSEGGRFGAGLVLVVISVEGTPGCRPPEDGMTRGKGQRERDERASQ